MRNRKLNIFLAIAVLLLIGWMLRGVFFQPGLGDLKSGFKEIAHYRNENNTGPIQHIFVVTVKDSLWQEQESYGNFQPHHKGGNTKVYYFLEGRDVPEKLYPGKINFDPKYNSACIALYEKTAMGNSSLTKKPFN